MTPLEIYSQQLGASSTSTNGQRYQDVANLYQRILGRDPDQGGLDYFVNSNLSIRDIALRLAGSAEGTAHNNGMIDIDSILAPGISNAPIAVDLAAIFGGLPSFDSPVARVDAPQPVITTGTRGDSMLGNIPQLGLGIDLNTAPLSLPAPQPLSNASPSFDVLGPIMASPMQPTVSSGATRTSMGISPQQHLLDSDNGITLNMDYGFSLDQVLGVVALVGSDAFLSLSTSDLIGRAANNVLNSSVTLQGEDLTLANRILDLDSKLNPIPLSTTIIPALSVAATIQNPISPLATVIDESQPMTRQSVSSSVPNAVGTITQQISSIYQEVLHRPADAGGLQYFVNSGMTAAQVRVALMNSPEYNQGLTNTPSDLATGLAFNAPNQPVKTITGTPNAIPANPAPNTSVPGNVATGTPRQETLPPSAINTSIGNAAAQSFVSTGTRGSAATTAAESAFLNSTQGIVLELDKGIAPATIVNLYRSAMAAGRSDLLNSADSLLAFGNGLAASGTPLGSASPAASGSNNVPILIGAALVAFLLLRK